MKKLLASITYTFNNFYNNLNTQGQMLFLIIILLIIFLFIILIITHIFQNIKRKKLISEMKKAGTSKVSVKETTTKEKHVEETHEVVSKNTAEIKDIADKIDKAINENSAPSTLTNFEEDQEKTAIISIDELMLKAKELEIIDDEQTGVNYLEKYNLEPSEVEEIVNKTTNSKNNEVKAFKVSQVISPVYGIRKEMDNEEEKHY